MSDQQIQWSRDYFEGSLSSQCWTYTQYDDGWEKSSALRGDAQLRELVELEYSLAPISDWAKETVLGAIRFPPFCPHGSFPQPYLEVLDGIGHESPPRFIHGCYTASPDRKRRMLDYVFCLDAWLVGTTPEQAAAEIEGRGLAAICWAHVCQELWDVLGDRTELKELLVRRTLHRQRWWIKSLVWDEDARNVFCQDQYLGDVQCPGTEHYGNPDFRDPYFAELQVSDVKQMEKELAEMCPDWPWFRSVIRDSWLCAPKAFRFLERLLWCIGKGKPSVSLPSHRIDGDTVPGFLQCEDTYPDSREAKEWVRAFVAGMRSWIAGHQPSGEVESGIHLRLGHQKPIKSWLTGLYLRKIELLNPYGAAT